MTFWQTITGSDLTREWKAFEARAAALPADHRAAWARIKAYLGTRSDFTGRNLVPILDSALILLEETAADGQSSHDVLGEDIEGFCAELAGGEGARDYRDRARDRLNGSVARKLGRLGG
ncbi:DUF1048 domain-containing protein [Actinokineospora auranticolor]|uniref:DNA-binding ferritin-like protein (Dps family) n=1 Tax=Actinokineospora auranticolor TaxID=155976 RepID=A0A2S6GNP1_9PSEU|nr:DUF1048 domain-containing protein [Actinokineospora auranticolor]PPK66848.1 DNA-binding ferritin-like protein (Dps family) [Actinokineospora auranticolor]